MLSHLLAVYGAAQTAHKVLARQVRHPTYAKNACFLYTLLCVCVCVCVAGTP